MSSGESALMGPPLANQPSSADSASPASAAASAAGQSVHHLSFRRQRASRACVTCHARKVRCDAASLGVPCTNCTAFNIECRIPSPKRKKVQGKSKDVESTSDREQSYQDGDSPNMDEAEATTPQALPSPVMHRDKSTVYNSPQGTPSVTLPEQYAAQQPAHHAMYTQFMKPKFARAPIKEAGRVAYLGESSNLTLLVHDQHGTTDVVHYPLPENVRGAKARINELDNMEIEILHQRGAFLLPPRALCDELVEAYFKWVAPVVPVVNRSRFMRQYRDPKNPPSLLLLQAVLLAGSRVCTNSQLMDSSGSTAPASMTFYKRVKALYDSNYEDDRITIVQALVLMSWYWEGPEDVTKNVFYWSRVAVIVAQGSGMHRSVEGSQLSRSDKRLWKRIWWTLFSRDRSVAVALGRPCGINPEDSDVEMICEDDFIEDEGDRPADYPPNATHVKFFINYVKLCEIMGLVLSQQYSVASKYRRTNAIDLTHSDMALADWLQNCPPEVQWDRSRHHYWAALLHANYYTTLCLLHRAHMPPGGSPSGPSNLEEAAYPSRNIAYQAASMITSIIEKLQDLNELRYTPAFILFSALIMHVYQMRSSNQSIVVATEQRMQICMNALKEVSKVWLVAKMVHTLFESILGNKKLEERLQKASGKRHAKAKNEATMGKTKDETPAKRKFDDIDMGFAKGGPPAPQVSYERSRPQTPAQTPSRDMSHQGMQSMSTTSPPFTRQNGDAFMGPSRAGTRPGSPFQPSHSYPGTPPDLFLITRNSPNISEEFWQNFQPTQLFPADQTINFPQFSPVQHHAAVDPQLSAQQQQQMSMHMQQQSPQQQASANQMQGIQSHAGNMSMPGSLQAQMADPGGQWSRHMDLMQGFQGTSASDDSWSQNSKGSQPPIAPSTLNVEDWFHFFGINGDAGAFHGF